MEKVTEILPILRLSDGLQRRTQQPDVVPLQDAGVGQGHRQVQAGLPAQRRQDALGLLHPDNALDNLDGQRLDIYVVGDVPVSHNGGRVGVDQDGRNAFLPQGLARLRAGVVKLGGLTNDDWPGTDYQDFVQLFSVTAQERFSSSVRSAGVSGRGQGRGRVKLNPAPTGLNPLPKT